MTDQSSTPKDADEPDVRQSTAKPDDKTHPENHQDKMAERLDDALEETFPSSDPISVKITK